VKTEGPHNRAVVPVPRKYLKSFKRHVDSSIPQLLSVTGATRWNCGQESRINLRSMWIRQIYTEDIDNAQITIDIVITTW